MRVIVWVAMSADGYIDDYAPERLILSSPEDWEEVYRLRSMCDAIVVGANTLRTDDPSLTIKNDLHRDMREARGQDRDITRVTLTGSGSLEVSLRFFAPEGRKIIFAPFSADLAAVESLAEIVSSEEITAPFVLRELERRGVETLIIEGGSAILRMFFEARMVDELRLAVAPFFTGGGINLLGDGASFGSGSKMDLRNVEMLGGMAVLHYDVLSDYALLNMAIEESRKSTPSITAYRVGAVVLTSRKTLYAGHTHETSADNHAEEEAIMKAIDAGEELHGATIYCSMEPCSVRKSRTVSCSEHIIRHGFSRVVYAFREPMHFVDGRGTETLLANGIETREIKELADKVIEINSHILG